MRFNPYLLYPHLSQMEFPTTCINYQLDQSISVSRVDIFIQILIENSVSKYWRNWPLIRRLILVFRQRASDDVITKSNNSLTKTASYNRFL